MRKVKKYDNIASIGQKQYVKFAERMGLGIMITKERAEEIVKEMYDKIFGLCYSKDEISEYDAQELTQDTFLLFYEKLDILEDDKISRWLITTAKIKCYEFYKKRNKRLLMLSLEESFNSIDDFLMVRDQYFKVTDAEIQKSLDVILKALTKDEYILYYKKFVEGKKHKEIAEELGITVGNVNSRSFRLRAKLEALAKIAFSGFGQFIIRTFF